MKKNKRFGVIIEQTVVVPNAKLEILEESYTEDKRPRVRFKSLLQESGVKNQNNRIYRTPVCESIVSQLSPKAKSRNLLMEVDHPLFGISDPQQLKRRAGIVEIKNCGAFVKDILFNRNQVIGEIQTLSGFLGPSTANLISKDKIDIGFSLRALGSVTPLTDGTLDVKMPIRAITYDLVSNPSHSNAKITEFLPESYMCESVDESEMMVLAEAQDLALLEQQDNIIIDNTNGNHYIQSFTDDLIYETFLDIINTGLRFKI